MLERRRMRLLELILDRKRVREMEHILGRKRDGAYVREM